MSTRDTVRMGALLQPDIRIQEEESELSAPQVSVLILTELTDQIKAEFIQLILQSVWI